MVDSPTLLFVELLTTLGCGARMSLVELYECRWTRKVQLVGNLLYGERCGA